MNGWRRIVAVAALAPAVGLAAPAAAHEYRVGGMLVVHPWAAATDATATSAAAFLTLRNYGSEADRLVSVDLPNATGFRFAATETGEATAEGGYARGLVVPPDGRLKLTPGTGFILVSIRGPLREHTMLAGTLTFERAGTVEVGFWVQEASSAGAVCAANPDGEPHD